MVDGYFLGMAQLGLDPCENPVDAGVGGHTVFVTVDVHILINKGNCTLHAPVFQLYCQRSQRSSCVAGHPSIPGVLYLSGCGWKEHFSLPSLMDVFSSC